MAVVVVDLEQPATCSRPSIGWRRVRRWSIRTVLIVCAFIAAANLAVAAVSWVMSSASNLDRPAAAVLGVGKLYRVDGTVWRGAHPSPAGYQSLAAAGVTVVVDLRAEDDDSTSDSVAEAAGLEVVHLPIRDGQLPTGEQVAAFVAIVHGATGKVFVHCGAGVGRTGAIVASYMVESGQSSGMDALAKNLAVGPPSIEQIWFAAGAEPGDFEHPPAIVTAVSRVLDAPRRLLSWL